MAPTESAMSDIYPAVRQFFEDAGLARALKSFDKETAQEDGSAAPAPPAGLTLLAACQLWVQSAQPAEKAGAAELTLANLYPAVRRFLDDASLTRTAKSFGKDTAGEEEEAGAVSDGLELTAACRLWVDAHEEAKRAKAEKKAAKKRKAEAEALAAAPEVVEEEAVEAPKKKKRKASDDLETPAAAVEAVSGAKAGKDKKEKKERTAGVPFSRVDHAKWTAAIKDDRLKDNTHEGKLKFGMGVNGDSWGDKASADLLAVKGKGFRKEMQKKKRASWRGGGEIDQGCNSVFFPDSDDE